MTDLLALIFKKLISLQLVENIWKYAAG